MVSQSAFDAAGKALDSAVGLFDALSPDPFADLGHGQMKSAASHASFAWTTGRASLGTSLKSESAQLTSAGLVFARVDQALAASVTETKK